MKNTLSTHVLDTANGKPAAGVPVSLFRDEVLIVATQTNRDGRTDQPLIEGDAFVPGTYWIEFDVGEYFRLIKHPDAGRFLDIVPIAFVVENPSTGYHVPLLCSPWSYSTYRGS